MPAERRFTVYWILALKVALTVTFLSLIGMIGGDKFPRVQKICETSFFVGCFTGAGVVLVAIWQI